MGYQNNIKPEIIGLQHDSFELKLTHIPLVLHICVSESGQYWFR